MSLLYPLYRVPVLLLVCLLAVPLAVADSVAQPVAPAGTALARLYASLPGPLLWHQPNGEPRQPLIDSLLKAVDLAVAQGLPAARYHDQQLSLEQGVERRDLLLSDALLRLVSDLGARPG